MRIVVLHGSNDAYGASRVLSQDVNVLSALGHEVSVCLPTDGPLTSAIEAAGGSVTVTRLIALRKVSSPLELRMPINLPRACANADVVVLWTLALAAYLPALRIRRRPTICSVHELILGPAGSALAAGTRLLCRTLIANSHATSAWLTAGRGGADVAYPVAPPYDPLPLQASPIGAVRLLLAGRMNGQKGHREAILATEVARQRGVAADLTLVGGPFPGQEKHATEIAAMARDRPWVHIAGEVPEIRAFLAAADVVLIPTIRPEPFGLVALEAWAAGRRVIASDGGGLAEVTKLVEGLPVVMGSVDSLASCIIRVANHPKARTQPGPGVPAATACSVAARRETWLRALVEARHGHAGGAR
jgi:glycosyltransferase involved in cell wall biosynthesis